MLVEAVRSGLPESFHQVAAVAVDQSGATLYQSGDVDRTFFFRSAAKPFQAAVSQDLGADLPAEHLAVACASHDGDPVHIAIVEAMLASAGLSESDLGCPHDWPLAMRGKRRVCAAGAMAPRRIWHNCSGKHAAMLRACVAQGWSTAGYLDPHHPLQRRISELMSEVAGSEVFPVGVDGCGAPVFRATVRTMAGAFLALASDHRFDGVRTAMQRYPALVSGVGNDDAVIATWLDAAAKRGAEASLGVALPGRGAIALKVWDGAGRAVPVAAHAILDALGWIPGGSVEVLRDALRSVVLGGGNAVGELRVVESS